jgi:hypothetical protein
VSKEFRETTSGFTSCGVALALQDQSWMPLPAAYKFDPITTDWTYVRWLRDRKGIENITKTWDKTVVTARRS